MCLGIPGQLVEIDDDGTPLATADVSGVKRRVDVGLLADEALSPGDWVLIHVGFAMAKIDEEEAARTLASLGVPDGDREGDLEAGRTPRTERGDGR